MKKVKLFFVLILMTCLIFPQSSFAKDTKKVGNVLSASGDVDIKKGGGNKLFKAFKNMAFTQGDIVITGSNGKAELSLDEDKEVVVAANTKLVISQLMSSVKAKSGKTNLTLVGGKVKVKINKKLEGESKFNIKTPNAIMGVMGTEFYVYYDEHGTWVGVLEGVVTVDIGEGGPIKVDANQSLFIDEEGNFEIVELDAEQVLRFVAESSEEQQEKPRRPIIVYDSEVSFEEDSDYNVPNIPDTPGVPDIPDEETGGGLPPVVPPVPPSQLNPTIVSVEKYNPDPELRNQLTIVFALNGDTLTKVSVVNDQNDLEEVEPLHYELVDDSILLNQEFLQQKLQHDQAYTEMSLTFASGFILPVTLERMALVEVDETAFQAAFLVEYQANKKIIIPFTLLIEFNEDGDQAPANLEEGISLLEDSNQTDISNFINDITIEDNKLIITLADELPISTGESYTVVITHHTLRNQENGVAQGEDIILLLPELN